MILICQQERVQHYASELGIIKEHTDDYKKKLRQHNFNVVVRRPNDSVP